MTPAQVEDLTRQFEDANATARRLVEGLSPAQLARRPAAGGWSVAECLVHLTLTAAAYVPKMEKTLDRMTAEGPRSDRPSRPDWVGRILKWYMEPPPRFRNRAPRPFQPGEIEPVSEVLPAFLSQQERIIHGIGRMAGLDLEAIKVRSAFSRRVRYNLVSALSIMAAHERRHLWQAEQVRKEAENHVGDSPL